MFKYIKRNIGIIIILLLCLLMSLSIYVIHQGMIETREDTRTTITVDIIDIQIQKPSYSRHGITLVKTSNMAYIFDNVESLPIGKCELTIQQSVYDGEYDLISYKKID